VPPEPSDERDDQLPFLELESALRDDPGRGQVPRTRRRPGGGLLAIRLLVLAEALAEDVGGGVIPVFRLCGLLLVHARRNLVGVTLVGPDVGPRFVGCGRGVAYGRFGSDTGAKRVGLLVWPVGRNACGSGVPDSSSTIRARWLLGWLGLRGRRDGPIGLRAERAG
jgi:hypothetical protein